MKILRKDELILVNYGDLKLNFRLFQKNKDSVIIINSFMSDFKWNNRKNAILLQ